MQDPSPLAPLQIKPPRLISFRAACARLKTLAKPQQGTGLVAAAHEYHLPPAGSSKPGQQGLEAELQRLQLQVRTSGGVRSLHPGTIPSAKLLALLMPPQSASPCC